MHQRLIVVSSHDGKSETHSPDTITQAVNEWLQENGFAHDGGRWTNGPSDWYVMGGRWSGCLSQYNSDVSHDDMTEYAKSIATKEEIEKEEWKWMGNDFTKKNTAKLNNWWQEKTETNGIHPWIRDSYQQREDDSMLLTEHLWKHFKDEGFDYQEEDGFIVVDRWEVPASLEEGDEQVDYNDETRWEDIKHKWNNGVPDADDFLEPPKTNDQIWLTVVDYHY